jgi:hypothetical protein
MLLAYHMGGQAATLRAQQHKRLKLAALGTASQVLAAPLTLQALLKALKMGK